MSLEPPVVKKRSVSPRNYVSSTLLPLSVVPSSNNDSLNILGKFSGEDGRRSKSPVPRDLPQVQRPIRNAAVTASCLPLVSAGPTGSMRCKLQRKEGDLEAVWGDRHIPPVDGGDCLEVGKLGDLVQLGVCLCLRCPFRKAVFRRILILDLSDASHTQTRQRTCHAHSCTRKATPTRDEVVCGTVVLIDWMDGLGYRRYLGTTPVFYQPWVADRGSYIFYEESAKDYVKFSVEGDELFAANEFPHDVEWPAVVNALPPSARVNLPPPSPTRHENHAEVSTDSIASRAGASTPEVEWDALVREGSPNARAYLAAQQQHALPSNPFDPSLANTRMGSHMESHLGTSVVRKREWNPDTRSVGPPRPLRSFRYEKNKLLPRVVFSVEEQHALNENLKQRPRVQMTPSLSPDGYRKGSPKPWPMNPGKRVTGRVAHEAEKTHNAEKYMPQYFHPPPDWSRQQQAYMAGKNGIAFDPVPRQTLRHY
eukprot:Rmarinus@m.23056